MRAYILAGLFSLFCLSSIAADTPSSDAMIQKRIVGTWLLNWIAFHDITTFGTNGDYLTYSVSNSVHSQTNRLEGTIEIRDGLMIDTLKKSSFTNQPVLPHVATNEIIRLTDHELIFRAQDRSQPVTWERIKP